MSGKQFIVLIACLFVVAALISEAIDGHSIAPFVLMAIAVLLVASTKLQRDKNEFSKLNEIRIDDQTVRLAQKIRFTGTALLILGPFWGVLSLGFLDSSTMRGLLLSLGVAAVAFALGAGCLIYSTTISNDFRRQ